MCNACETCQHQLQLHSQNSSTVLRMSTTMALENLDVLLVPGRGSHACQPCIGSAELRSHLGRWTKMWMPMPIPSIDPLTLTKHSRLPTWRDVEARKISCPAHAEDANVNENSSPPDVDDDGFGESRCPYGTWPGITHMPTMHRIRRAKYPTSGDGQRCGCRCLSQASIR